MRARRLLVQSWFLPLLTGSALVLLCLWVVLWGYPDINQWLFQRVNALGARGDVFWQQVTVLGEGLVAFVLLASFSARNGRFIWMLLLAALIAGVASQTLKHWLDMPRPAVTLGAESFNLIGWELRARAFPSGHATTALVAAVMATWRFPAWKYAIYAVAVLIALSRIVVGAHWPFDVIAGGCLGYLSGRATLWLVARARFKDTSWQPVIAWLVLLVMAIWLAVFPLEYPLARALVLIIAAAGVVVALLNLRRLLVK